MKEALQEYPWIEELEKTVVNSLTTTFGLDFLLFKDKVGGEVDTIHNVRQGIYASEYEKDRYKNKESYNSDSYHSHKNYINKGKADKELLTEGGLYDEYRGGYFKWNEDRDLDHIISAYEIDNDPGRMLAEINGVALANDSSNLQSTASSINRAKKESSIPDFIKKKDYLIENRKKTLSNNQKKLKEMPNATANDKHEIKKIESKIKNDKSYIEKMESIDPRKMLEKDQVARQKYNNEINKQYYYSAKFAGNTALTSMSSGLRMGCRQMLGLMMAEVWFELRENIPSMLKKQSKDFSFGVFLDDIKESIKGIWNRIKIRFKDFLASFKDGAIAGFFSNLSTVLINIFLTTSKLAIKFIREAWNSLVSIIKLMVFNPDNLSFIEICQAITKVLNLASSTIVGTMVYAQLAPICTFPFGSELAAFLSALATGLTTLGLNYVLLYSNFAKKLWAWFEERMPYISDIKKYQAINQELDRYLEEWKNLDFNIDSDSLLQFTIDLSFITDEGVKGSLLSAKIKESNIEMPYNPDSEDDFRNFLKNI